MLAPSYSAHGPRTSSITHGALGLPKVSVVQRRPVGLPLAAALRAPHQAATPANAANQEVVTDWQRQPAEQGVQIADLQRQLAECKDQRDDLQRRAAAWPAAYRGEVTDLLRRSARRQEQLTDIMQKLHWIQEYRTQKRNNALGGLLAYTVEGVVSAAVLGPGRVTYYLSELKEAIEDGEKDSATCARWHTVVPFLERRSGVSVDRLVANMRPLVKYPVVKCGTEAEVSKADLQQWASSRGKRVKVAVDQLLLILEPLTHPGQPLCPLDQTAINKVFQLEA